MGLGIHIHWHCIAGLDNPFLRDGFKISDTEFLLCLDGFNIVFGQNMDIIHVSENVTNFIGLSQVVPQQEGFALMHCKDLK